MPSILTDSAVALARLQAMLQYAEQPAMTATEVSDLLDEFAIASVWDDATEFLCGAHCVPTVPNGRWYISLPNDEATNITGATEPDWGSAPEYPWGATGTITDGTVTWIDDGPAPLSLWDLNAAASEGWTRKAGKVAAFAGGSMKAGSLEIRGGDAKAACLAMARRYQRAGTL